MYLVLKMPCRGLHVELHHIPYNRILVESQWVEFFFFFAKWLQKLLLMFRSILFFLLLQYT